MLENSRIMSSKLLLYSVLPLICIFSGCGQHQEPHLVLSSYQYDFGKVKRGKVCTGEIYVYNRGNAILKINRFHADCSCTQVSINKRHIAAGDSAILKFSLDTRNKTGEANNIIIIEANTDSLVHYAEIQATVDD